MLSFLFRTVVVLATLAFLTVLAWPELAGLQNAWVVAHAVSFRGLAVAVAIALLALLAILLLLVRPLRATTALLMVLLVVFGAVNSGILLHRGLGSDAAVAAVAAKPADTDTASTGRAADADGAITVLSWNTLGDAPGAGAIADLAIAEEADVLTLPETTEETGVLVAEAMRAAGRPMWVHTVSFDLISKARSTTLLISPELGDYTVSSAEGSGPPGNTNVLPTVIAEPADGAGPTIIAVHAVAPIRWEMANWRSDLDWLAEQCNGETAGAGAGGVDVGGVIMAGDFNATIDHFAGRATSDGAVLGDCLDAAALSGSGGVGTWPAWAPSLLGAPIDHVLATPDWQVERMNVIGTEDTAGSDHRPIVATLSAVAG
ncbi:endonuclease/exonuclease/phosphatase family protein [Cryobacterium adonitolivorans]|uniref:Endonuclease/exonuclease/phosphatase family protein n=1 Tax=Cryobacterium adonitolivorans TaxID=1259189 RepID=A0A4R8WA34_9MICO|nr:endonuclease/exonuclease/phosphatase family protein [Cryobacterium adonitolivorans]TFC03494.1 endonuclease/exonuclease/phosphatase family protein [Cryobacterium adonitolivorans]